MSDFFNCRHRSPDDSKVGPFHPSESVSHALSYIALQSQCVVESSQKSSNPSVAGKAITGLIFTRCIWLLPSNCEPFFSLMHLLSNCGMPGRVSSANLIFEGNSARYVCYIRVVNERNRHHASVAWKPPRVFRPMAIFYLQFNYLIKTKG